MENRLIINVGRQLGSGGRIIAQNLQKSSTAISTTVRY